MLIIIRALTALVLVIFAINAVAVVAVLALAAGLIFRTKQTLVVLGLFAALATFSAHPSIGMLVAGAFVIIVFSKQVNIKNFNSKSY